MEVEQIMEKVAPPSREGPRPLGTMPQPMDVPDSLDVEEDQDAGHAGPSHNAPGPGDEHVPDQAGDPDDDEMGLMQTMHVGRGVCTVAEG